MSITREKKRKIIEPKDNEVIEPEEEVIEPEEEVIDPEVKEKQLKNALYLLLKPKIEKINVPKTKKRLENTYNQLMKRQKPTLERNVSKYIDKLSKDIEKLTKSIDIIVEADKKVKSVSSSQSIESSPKIIPSEQKEALLYAGLNEDNIVKYGIVGEYKDDLSNWWVKKDGTYEEDKLNLVADLEQDYHDYYNNIYTPKQLAKTYNKIATSFIIQKIDKCEGKTIIHYLFFIKKHPKFALPTLLWIDTFHDFKEERLNQGKRNLNEIIDHLCFKIYGHRWRGLAEGGKKEVENDGSKCYTIRHYYNFDKMYQNSFFNFNDKYEVTGFHPDVKHTVLKPLVVDVDGNKLEVAKLLYDVSNIFMDASEGWEGDFLYAYLMYNFDFNMDNKDGLIQNLKDIFWNEIKAYKDDEYSIPYYAKDVDKGSSNFFKGTNVILPASLFDANRSNSSQVIEEFVPIEKTIIPLCSGYDFVYKYTGSFCNLTLEYSNDKKSHTLCDNIANDYFSNNSSCVNTKKSDKYPGTIKDFIGALSNYKIEQKETELNYDIDYHIETLLRLIRAKKYTKDILKNINDTLKAIKKSVSYIYFLGNMNKGCVKLPNGQGMSPGDCVSVVIGLLINVLLSNKNSKIKYKQDHPLSPISCKYLDFWVALKRIGDFGQIMQCKQLGIPLFTNDNMQLLISMAACSSAVWTGDNAKVLWYDSTQDAILCNKLNPDFVARVCDKKRLNDDDKNIYIHDALMHLNSLPTREDYTKLITYSKILNKFTDITFDDYFNNVFNPNIMNSILSAIESSDQIKEQELKKELKQYIYLKIQEQIGFIDEKIQEQYLPELQTLKTNLQEVFEKELKELQVKLQAQLTPQTTLQLQAKLQAELQDKIKAKPPLKYIVDQQLKFNPTGDTNYIPYRKVKEMLVKTSYYIESKIDEKLSDINNIRRNGCIITVDDKEEEMKEAYGEYHHDKIKKSKP